MIKISLRANPSSDNRKQLNPRLNSARVLILFLLIASGGCGDQEFTRTSQSAGGGDNSNPTEADLERVSKDNTLKARYAIIVGINSYEDDEFNDLNCAVHDAEVLAKTLIKEYGYKESNIQCLIDSKASIAGIQSILTTWLDTREITENDSLLFYFAGHGDSDGQLALSDTTKQSIDTWLAIPELIDSVKRVPCYQKLLILDSCYSGSLFTKRRRLNYDGVPAEAPSLGDKSGDSRPFTSGKRGVGTNNGDPFFGYAKRPSFLGISAGRDTTVEDAQGSDGHSIFTGALLASMKDRAMMDRDDEGYFGSALAGDVERRVVSVSHSSQTPDWGYLSAGTGDFLLLPSPEYRKGTFQSRASKAAQMVQVESFATSLEQAQQDWQKGQFQQVQQVLDSYGSDSDYSSRFSYRLLSSLMNPGGAFGSVVSSDTEQWVAFAHDDNNIFKYTNDHLELVSLSSEHAAKVTVDDLSGRIIGCSNGYLVTASLGTSSDKEDPQVILTLHNAFTGEFMAERRVSVARTWTPHYLQCGEGTRIAVFSGSTAKIIDMMNEETPVKLELVDNRYTDSSKHEIQLAAVGHQGKRIAASDAAGRILIWSASTGKKLGQIETGRGETLTSIALGSVAYSDPDSQSLISRVFSGSNRNVVAAGFEDGTLELWDSQLGEKVGLWKAHTDTINSLKFAHDNSFLGSSGLDGSVRGWNAKHWITYSSLDEQLRLDFELHGLASAVLNWSPTTSKLLIRHDRGARIYDTQQLARNAGRVPEDDTDFLHEPAYSLDGQYFVQGWNNSVGCWNTETGNLLWEWKLENDKQCIINARPIGTDGMVLVHLGNKNFLPDAPPGIELLMAKSAGFFQLVPQSDQTGYSVERINLFDRLRANGNQWRSSSDGSKILSTFDDGVLVTNCDPETEEVAILVNHATPKGWFPSYEEMSEDGTRIAIVDSPQASNPSQISRLFCYSIDKGALQGVEAVAGDFAALAIDAMRNRIVAIRDREPSMLEIRDLSTGALLRKCKLSVRIESPSSCDVSNEGRTIAIACPNAVIFFDIETGIELLRWPCQCDFHQVEFLGDNSTLVIGSLVGTSILRASRIIAKPTP